MINKRELLDAFKNDMRAADTLRQEMVARVDTWKKQYNGEPYGNEQKGKSEFVSRDIKRQDEWQHASIKDPFVSHTDIIKCLPVTYEDRLAANQNELVLNYQFTRLFNRYKFMTDAIKLYYSEGTVIVKTSWEYEDEVVEGGIGCMSADDEEEEAELSVEASTDGWVKISSISPKNRKKVYDYWSKQLNYPKDFVKLMVKDYEK